MEMTSATMKGMATVSAPSLVAEAVTGSGSDDGCGAGYSYSGTDDGNGFGHGFGAYPFSLTLRDLD
jgi:hypothetical protein